ncbi:hypothetical protein NKH48_36350 [Mesorhizobium sp. M1233]|uniref:hypothetical protein n=1 Tax=Mesorhizobium sp. M1233 TaxID=2957072 RepID=UPI0033388830
MNENASPQVWRKAGTEPEHAGATTTAFEGPAMVAAVGPMADIVEEVGGGEGRSCLTFAGLMHDDSSEGLADVAKAIDFDSVV